MAVYPGLNLTFSEINTLIDYTVRIGLGLQVKGLMNIQFVIKRETYRSSVFVLEVNPRASRTVPFLSKVTGVPMVKLATKIMLGISLQEQGYKTGLWTWPGLVAVKTPVFSMSKLVGVDTYLGPEMKSTGEVMGIDYTFEAALTKSLLAAGLMLPLQGTILLSIADRDKAEALPIIRRLSMVDYKLYATEGTAAIIEKEGLPVKFITKKLGEGHPNVVDVIYNGWVDGVVNTLTRESAPLRDGFAIRRAAAEKRTPCFTSLDTIRAAVEALVSGDQVFSIKPMREYLAK